MIKKLILVVIFINLFLTNLYSIENKIIIKIDNEIITSLDLYNEVKYLVVMNNSLKNLDKEKIYKISKNSIIRERIKRIEINRSVKNAKINDRYLNQIIQSIYKKLGINSLEEFNAYLSNNDLNIKDIKDKLATEGLWNQLIFSKYSNKIKIDEKKIKEKILRSSNKELKSYNLSEILFNVEQGIDYKKKFENIKNTILKEGFENAALMYSISSSGKTGGKIGWVNENSINKKIKSKIEKITKDQFTDSIPMSGGFLILKVNDIKKVKKKINLDEELKKLVQIEKNQQLNQFSNMYYQKVKKDLQINEL